MWRHSNHSKLSSMELCVWVSEINIEKINLEELVNKKVITTTKAKHALVFSRYNIFYATTIRSEYRK